MTADLNLSGPTVTLFGNHDALDDALSLELGRRGCSVHAVTTPVGWLDSTTHAVIRLDTPTGERALDTLLTGEADATHVVAVCGAPADAAEMERLSELCRRCSERHDVSLIWHPQLEVRFDGPSQEPHDVPVPHDLAVAITDEVGYQTTAPAAPSFATQTYPQGRHRRHS